MRIPLMTAVLMMAPVTAALAQDVPFGKPDAPLPDGLCPEGAICPTFGADDNPWTEWELAVPRCYRGEGEREGLFICEYSVAVNEDDNSLQSFLPRLCVYLNNCPPPPDGTPWQPAPFPWFWSGAWEGLGTVETP